MAAFMIVQLQGGRLDTIRILQTDSVATMHKRQFTNHEALSGMTYGFQEHRLGGERILAQPGDMLHFSSALYLLPERGLGLYVAYNRGHASQAGPQLLQALLARYLPSPPPIPVLPRSDFTGDLVRFAGRYRSTRRSETTLEKLQELFAPVRVRVAPNDLLRVSGLASVPDSLWAETEPLVFHNLARPGLLASLHYWNLLGYRFSS
jgi:hypothetical protein